MVRRALHLALLQDKEHPHRHFHLPQRVVVSAVGTQARLTLAALGVLVAEVMPQPLPLALAEQELPVRAVTAVQELVLGLPLVGVEAAQDLPMEQTQVLVADLVEPDEQLR